jgi:hypothetical protein
LKYPGHSGSHRRPHPRRRNHLHGFIHLSLLDRAASLVAVAFAVNRILGGAVITAGPLSVEESEAANENGKTKTWDLFSKPF